MKKGGKTLLAMGIATTMAIGTIGITNITNMQKDENKATIQAYNHTPANILDNVFTLNNNKYLPFVFNNTKEVITKTKIIQEFTKAGLEIENISCREEAVGTGTTITVKGSSDVYTVIVYGDVDGDGTINVFDALRIVENIATDNKITGTAFQIAANVENGDNLLDVFDALRIVGVIAGEVDKLVVNEPEADPVDPGPTPDEDTEKPTISIGQPVISINFGESYLDNDDDITANDNKDGDISNKVVREKIEFVPAGSSNKETVTTISTDRIGIYTITYKVSDSSGNTETSTRTITVKGLSSIKVGEGSQELNFAELNLYITKPTTSTGITVEKDPTDQNVYSIIPITFYDQNGTPIDEKITAAEIQKNIASVAEGKLDIDFPEGIITKYYDKNGIEVSEDNKTTPVKQIGFAMSLQGQDKADISQLDGQKIVFKCRNKVIELPIAVMYKPLQNLDLNVTTDVTTIGRSTKGNYYGARLSKKATEQEPEQEEIFTVGIIEIGEQEQPITQKMIDDATISFDGNLDVNKIEMWYEIDSQGRILVKGKVYEEGDYIIKPMVGNVKSKTAITLRGMDVEKDLTISIGNADDYSIKLVGEEDEENVLYTKQDVLINGKTGQVKVKDVDYVQQVDGEPVDYLIIGLTDADGSPLEDAENVDKIWLQVNEDAVLPAGEINIMVTIKVYDGLTGIAPEPKTIMIHIVR